MQGARPALRGGRGSRCTRLCLQLTFPSRESLATLVLENSPSCFPSSHRIVRILRFPRDVLTVRLVPGEILYLKSGSDFRAPACSSPGLLQLWHCRARLSASRAVAAPRDCLPGETAVLAAGVTSVRAKHFHEQQSVHDRPPRCGSAWGKGVSLARGWVCCLFVCLEEHRGRLHRAAETRHKLVRGHRWVTPVGFKGKGAWAPSFPRSTSLSARCLEIQSGICCNVTIPL